MKHKNILITGGTGSWGNEIVKQLTNLEDPPNITVMARNEANIVKMSRQYPQVKFVLGDVRDYDKVYNVLKGIDIVFHLAAVKHVPICEEQPEEAIQTNIHGSLNLVKACQRHGIVDAVLVSTDKAVEPINTYGISKAMAEKIFLNANFKVIRAGNVIGSSGSVIPLFKRQIKEGIPVTLTHKDMTRFFMTLPEAINLVVKAYKECLNGEIAVLDMCSFKLTDVIEVLSGVENYPTTIIGIRPGEKLHEVLISEGEYPNAYFLEDKQMFIISKIPKGTGVTDKYSSKNVETNILVLGDLLIAAGY